jgi:hypothetical protein
MRSALAALAVARVGRRRIAGLAGRDRERLQAAEPGHGGPVPLAGERYLKSGRQPVTWMAGLVLFSTTTRAGINVPAVIVRLGNTTRAESGADECRFPAR